MGFQGEKVQQIVVRIAHIGALRRGGAGGDPVETEQSHHVVYPQSVPVAEPGPQ